MTPFSLGKIGGIEINEVFAAQNLAVMRTLNLIDNVERLNTNCG